MTRGHPADIIIIIITDRGIRLERMGLWCNQPSDRGLLKDRTIPLLSALFYWLTCQQPLHVRPGELFQQNFFTGQVQVLPVGSWRMLFTQCGNISKYPASFLIRANCTEKIHLALNEEYTVPVTITDEKEPSLLCWGLVLLRSSTKCKGYARSQFYIFMGRSVPVKFGSFQNVGSSSV